MSKISEQPYFQDVAKIVALLANEHPELLEELGTPKDGILELKNNPLSLVEEAFQSFPEDLYFDLFHLDPIGCALDVLHIEDSSAVSEKILPTYRRYRSENKLRLVTMTDLALEQLKGSSKDGLGQKSDDLVSTSSDLAGQKIRPDYSAVDTNSGQTQVALIEIAIDMLSVKEKQLKRAFSRTGINITSIQNYTTVGEIFSQVFICISSEWHEDGPVVNDGILITVSSGTNLNSVDIVVSVAMQEKHREFIDTHIRESLFSVTASTAESLETAFEKIDAIEQIKSLKQRAPVLRRLQARAATKSAADADDDPF